MAGRNRLRSQHLVAFAEAAQSHWILISIATVLAGAITYGVFVSQPRYTSTALLAIDEPSERIAESIMRSTAVTESVLAKFPGIGSTSEQRKQYLQKNLRISAAMSGRTNTLYDMQVTHSDPAVAQQIASALINRWLELTKPRAVKKAELEDELARNQALENELSSLLKRLETESTSLVNPNSLQGELATPIHALTEKRDDAQKAIAKIKAQLEGTPRDVVMVAPNLPTERSSSAGQPALLVSCLVLIGMLAFAEFHSVILPKWRDSLAAFKAERARRHPLLQPVQNPDASYRTGVSQQRKEQDEPRVLDRTRGLS